MNRRERYHFVVVCPNAAAVFLMGAFNGWSTTATPLRKTEPDVWQLDVEMPGGETDFSYFVIDERWQTGRAPFGNTFMLPGTWAKVFRTPGDPSPAAPSNRRPAPTGSAAGWSAELTH
jgi:1,4-alpha-glucan branching enzyme